MRGRAAPTCAAAHRFPFAAAKSYRVVVDLCQKAEYDEETVLGFAVPSCEGYPIRIPIMPQAGTYHSDDPPATVTVLPPKKKGLCPLEEACEPKGCRVHIEVEVPEEPTQVAVDPDQLLVDKDPSNNYWKAPIRCALTPVYTFLEETDLTNAYDRWNFIFGPWV